MRSWGVILAFLAFSIALTQSVKVQIIHTTDSMFILGGYYEMTF